MDVCVQVSVIDNGSPSEGGYSVGDMVAAHPAAQMGTWSGSEYTREYIQPNTAYVFLIGVPIDNIYQFELQNQREWDPQDDSITTRHQRWGLQQTRIPPGQWNRFLRDGYATFTWEQAKLYIERKAIGITLTDADLGAP